MAEPEERPPCVACARYPCRVGWLCPGCYHHTDERLYDLALYWPLMSQALLEPSTGIEQRVSGSRERPLPGGEALSLSARGHVHVSDWPAGVDRDDPDHRALAERGWIPASVPAPDSVVQVGSRWRLGDDRPDCASEDEATRPDGGTETVTCCLKAGHVERHREHHGPDAHTWPYPRRATGWRVPVRENGRPVLRPPGDQTGDIAPVEKLWSWTRDWVERRNVGESGPNPDLPGIVAWLRARLDWAAEQHPAVDDFVTEVRAAADTMRERLSVKRYVQRFTEPCPRCDVVALYREIDPNKDPRKAWGQCGSCGNLWREEEFGRLGVILEGEARRAR